MARDPNAAPAEGQGEGEHGEEDTTVLQEEKP